MRYTTIIDISEYPAIYRSEAARMVYLHLVLKSGYHDHDRDLADLSLRRIAKETGVTVSAARCALAALQRANLVTRQGGLWYVKKWVVEQPITPRPKTAARQKAIERKAIEEQEREERQRRMQVEEQKRLNLRAAGKTSFMLYVEDLKARAEAGDEEARRQYERHRATYEAHARSVREDAAP